jgi:YD repeat-containing protein
VVYDAASNVIASVDQLGNRTTISYDALNRPYQTQDALGDLATVVYDAASNVIASVDPRGNRTSFAWVGVGPWSDPPKTYPLVNASELLNEAEAAADRGGFAPF